MKPLCDYCGMPARLVTGQELYPHRDDLQMVNAWKCDPCEAWVGCHRAGVRVLLGTTPVISDGTLPLGRLAKSDLRAAKQRAHATFDPYWKNMSDWLTHPAYDPAVRYAGARRRRLYAWLAKEMGIPPHQCHIGMFDVEQCQQVVQIMSRVGKMRPPCLAA